MSEKKSLSFLSEPMFIERANQCEDKEAFRALLAEYGEEADAAEAEQLLRELAEMTDPGEGELSEDVLENVSGGAGPSFWLLGWTASRLLRGNRFHGGGGRT